jgi:cell wall-associated NlpC family hydrolase
VRKGARGLLPAAVAALALLGTAADGVISAGALSSGSHIRAAVRPATGERSASPVPALGEARSASFSVPVARLDSSEGAAVAPLGRLREADVFVVAPSSLPPGTVAALRRLPGVVAAESLDAARLRVNGQVAAMIGVDPSTFRRFAARPTARSDQLWQSVANGAIAVSYTMGRLDKLPLGGLVQVAGTRTESLRAGGFGTVGIGGVDVVVSHAVARSLGLPAANAIVVSAPNASLPSLLAKIRRTVPHNAAVEPLVSQVVVHTGTGTSTGAGTAGSAGGTSAAAGSAQTTAMLRAALSRQGLPYVWGGSGPGVFDCSGLVQWSFAQAGITMPRVAADQARTGPAIPTSQLQAGDLLFYHTDPTAPGYISHVAIYLGNGLMIQAPQPGMNVAVVPVVLGTEYAGAVRVSPQIAAAVAGGIGG